MCSKTYTLMEGACDKCFLSSHSLVTDTRSDQMGEVPLEYQRHDGRVSTCANVENCQKGLKDEETLAVLLKIHNNVWFQHRRKDHFRPTPTLQHALCSLLFNL